jgi:hypothetical protein
MILKKHRMFTDNGYIETLDEQEAINSGLMYTTIFEEIPEETTEDNG